MINRATRAALALFAALLVGCDHATKHAAKVGLEGARPIELVPGVLSLRYAENHDTAFSLLTSFQDPSKPWVLATLSILVTLGMAAVWYRRRAAPLLEHVGYAAVAGGALGNVIDRVARGYVIDFVHLRYWPVFNVADVAIVFGAALLVIAARGRDRPDGGAPPREGHAAAPG